MNVLKYLQKMCQFLRVRDVIESILGRPPKSCEDLINDMATMTLKESQQGTMKKQMEDILLAISWRELSTRYFGKSCSWLYHKLDGVDGNKKPTDFTLEER